MKEFDKWIHDWHRDNPEPKVSLVVREAYKAGMLAAADIAYRSAGRCSTVIASRIRKAADDDKHHD